MTQILHIDSSILQESSVTRLLSAETVRQLKEKFPEAVTRYRDVVQDEIPHLTGEIAAGFRALPVSIPSDDVVTQHRLSDHLVEEFLASDIIVIGAPMYNFSVSSQLKSWLDRLAQAGKTFRYTDKGPVGLSGGRTVVIASGRGGFYHCEPFSSMDFQERYLQAYFRFLGITNVHFIRAEGASKGEEVREHEIQNALKSAKDLVAEIALNHQ